MKLFSTLIALLLPVLTLSAMPGPCFQDVGTANLSFYSNGTIGATVGVFNEQKIKGEVAFDYSLKNANPFSMAAKIGVDEGLFSPYCPSFCAGIFGADFKTTAEPLVAKNILYVMISKSWEKSRFDVGYFYGNKNLGINRDGVFVGITQHLWLKKVDDVTQISLLDLHAEYVFGNSVLSGAKIELSYLISDQFSIKTGPSWNFTKIDPTLSKWNVKNLKWLMSFTMKI